MNPVLQIHKYVFFVPDDGPSEGPKHVAFLYKQWRVIVFEVNTIIMLTTIYWILQWRRKHLIRSCVLLVSLTMTLVCAWVDWVCW